MRIESKLCHLSENKAIVQVNGWLNEKNVGSALAEGSTVEIAEDNAISRLYKRLNLNNNKINISSLDPKNESVVKAKVNQESTKIDLNQNDNKNQEPSDWSNELTAIDSEISRLKWTRDDEIKCIQENFGYNSRNKFTKYKELLNYLNILKNIEPNNSTDLGISNINSLIEESDIILKDLSWDYKQGREYLMKEFNVSTRKELNEGQLISFISKLKSIRNQYSSL